jgi:hypothetical protein
VSEKFFNPQNKFFKFYCTHLKRLYQGNVTLTFRNFDKFFNSLLCGKLESPCIKNPNYQQSLQQTTEAYRTSGILSSLIRHLRRIALVSKSKLNSSSFNDQQIISIFLIYNLIVNHFASQICHISEHCKHYCSVF